MLSLEESLRATMNFAVQYQCMVDYQRCSRAIPSELADLPEAWAREQTACCDLLGVCRLVAKEEMPLNWDDINPDGSFPHFDPPLLDAYIAQACPTDDQGMAIEGRRLEQLSVLDTQR